MQVPIPNSLKLAVRPSAVWIVEAVVTEGTIVIIAISATGAHARACSVPMNGDFSRRKLRTMIPITIRSPLALPSQIEVVAERGRPYPVQFRLVCRLGRVGFQGNLDWRIKTMAKLVIFNSLRILSFCRLDGDILVSTTACCGIAGRILDRCTAITRSGDIRCRN